MELILVHAKDTKNFATYESADMDFRYPYQVKARLWIPFEEFGNGVIPNQITVKICDDGPPIEAMPAATGQALWDSSDIPQE